MLEDIKNQFPTTNHIIIKQSHVGFSERQNKI